MSLATRTPETADLRYFDGQRATLGGGLMCTCASLHWLLASLVYKKRDFSTPDVMSVVMDWALKQYRSLSNISRHLLSHEDVLKHRPLPPCLTTESYNGHYLTAPTSELKEFGNVVHMESVHTLLQPHTGCMITANDHTVALYCDGTHQLWFFDSMPALEQRVDQSSLRTALQRALSTFDVSDITVVATTDQTNKRFKPNLD